VIIPLLDPLLSSVLFRLSRRTKAKVGEDRS
jgi:hypothetical protein